MNKRHVVRYLHTRLASFKEEKLVMLTGARQTGKTTLVKRLWPDLPYHNLDALDIREALGYIPATRWGKDVGIGIFDEVQKLPGIFEKIKYAHDAGAVGFSVLTGSSQILLLKNIRETLAGRVFLYELFPLMLAELANNAETVPLPLLARIASSTRGISPILEAEPSVLVGTKQSDLTAAMDYLLTWGGMPELLNLNQESRRQWLKAYRQTYLERDLGDLARLNDLAPFSTLQQLAALRTGQLLSFASLAKDGGISPNTARHYIEYLRLSYQTFLMQPYYRNLTSSTIKAPKIYWMDIGLYRSLTGREQHVDGQIFETFVVGEIVKWIRSADLPVKPYFYRTRSGMEVDLLLERGGNFTGMEIKNRPVVDKRDYSCLKALAQALGRGWRGGMVVTRGGAIELLVKEENIWQVPAERLLT